MTTAKRVALGSVAGTVRRFVRSPLWFRAAVALVVLSATATSAYAFVALLIIPKPIVDWIRVRALAFAKKLGVTRGLDTLWRRAVPAPLRHRGYLFAKWRLGRRQVLTSRRVHRRVERRVAGRLARRRAVGGAGAGTDVRPDADFDVGPSAGTDAERPEEGELGTDLDVGLAAGADAELCEWTRTLPPLVDALRERWRIVELRVLVDGGHDGTASWVAACTLDDGRDAVLKLSRPHDEGRDEIPGLAFWDGDPCVRLLAGDAASGAMLLERCVPGTSLRERPEAEQDEVVASLLRRLRRTPSAPHPFRPLADQVRLWNAATTAGTADVSRSPVLIDALAEVKRLAEPGSRDVLLATDLHAGNVLAATRAPWLVIDPKPYVGDPAYDLTQHLLNSRERLAADPVGACARLATLAGVDPDRARRWLAARLVAEPGGWYRDDPTLAPDIAARLRAG